MYITICTVCSSTNKCIIKKTGSNRGRDGGKVELAVPDVELEAALTTGRLIGTTGRIAPPLPYLDLSLVP